MNISKLHDGDVKVIKSYHIDIEKYMSEKYMRHLIQNLTSNLAKLDFPRETSMITRDFVEIFKNSYQHATRAKKLNVQLMDSEGMIFISYSEDTTTFYNSESVKKLLEKGKNIPTQKKTGKGGHGTRRITKHTDIIHLNVAQETLFLGYKKPD